MKSSTLVCTLHYPNTPAPQRSWELLPKELLPKSCQSSGLTNVNNSNSSDSLTLLT